MAKRRRMEMHSGDDLRVWKCSDSIVHPMEKIPAFSRDLVYQTEMHYP